MKYYKKIGAKDYHKAVHKHLCRIYDHVKTISLYDSPDVVLNMFRTIQPLVIVCVEMIRSVVKYLKRQVQSEKKLNALIRLRYNTLKIGDYIKKDYVFRHKTINEHAMYLRVSLEIAINNQYHRM